MDLYTGTYGFALKLEMIEELALEIIYDRERFIRTQYHEINKLKDALAEATDECVTSERTVGENTKISSEEYLAF